MERETKPPEAILTLKNGGHNEDLSAVPFSQPVPQCPPALHGLDFPPFIPVPYRTLGLLANDRAIHICPWV